MDLSNPEIKLPNLPVTGTPVTALPLRQQIEVMIAWARQNSSRVVCVANVHMLMESRWNAELRVVLESADLITPDGMPLVWMMRALGASDQDRVAGLDIFLAVCEKAVKHNISIYLLGSTQDILNKMLVKLEHQFPGLKIAGVESPPFRPMTQVEDHELIERINHSGAGVTFVALGCPKQECWMAAHHGKIKSVMVGVGAVFPVYAGLKKHAPKWVREIGLEWLYRLIQEPKRLFWRYLTTIPPFIWFALQQLGFERNHQRSLKS
jgi:N-acetylglucosaminyldiphosphoundecaprenol N-acetyl-beta-D-mannosaminyltransferase